MALIDELQQRVEQAAPVVGAKTPGASPPAAETAARRRQSTARRAAPAGTRRCSCRALPLDDLGSSRTCWPTVRPRSQSGWSSEPTKRSSLGRHRARTGSADRCPSAGRATGGHSRRARTESAAPEWTRAFSANCWMSASIRPEYRLDLPAGPAMPGGGVYLTSVAKHRARRRLFPSVRDTVLPIPIDSRPGFPLSPRP